MKALHLLLVLLAFLTAACGGASGVPDPAAGSGPDPATEAGESTGDAEPGGDLADSGLGDGFVVWESNRGGVWRLWRRDLAGSEPRALTEAEPGRAHCCAHVSPDGGRMAFVSLPVGQADYPKSGAAGELRLLDLASGETRVLADSARTYGEHRAAVWHDDDTLAYLDDTGRTLALSVASDGSGGGTKVLVDQTQGAHGWLVDRTLSYATEGTPTFSLLDAAAKRVRERPELGGCQPYFAHHASLGVWVAGAGGPIRAMDLASRDSWTLVGKGDARLPGDRRYLYFPMPSRDGRLLVWAASDGGHDHTRADYDVFVAETDPQTLELIGPPWRVSHRKSTDRFPDVWVAPLALGRHVGEAPLTLDLTLPDDAHGSEWTWQVSAGEPATATGRSVRATWTTPGRHAVIARSSDGRELRGRVDVAPAAPPRIVSAEPRRGGEELWLRFDEPVSVGDARVALQSGVGLEPSQLRDGDRVWVLRPARMLDRPDRLTVRGVADRAQTPNVLAQATVVVAPALWPSRTDGLVFLWQDAEHANRVVDPVSGREEVTVLERRDRSWFDRHGAAELRGGFLHADDATRNRLYEGLRATNELSLELTFRAERAATDRPAALFGFGLTGKRRNLTLTQEGDRLLLRLNTPGSNPGGKPAVDVGAVTGESQHLVISYTPGRLRAFLDGEKTADTDVLRGGFYHWQNDPLRLGAEGTARGADPWLWRGSLEGVALWSRALDADEAAENRRRYAEILRGRDDVETTTRRLELSSRSRTPTLQQIAPYEEALAVFEYRDLDRGEPVYVVHRVLVAGRELPITGLRPGIELRLALEPFDAHGPLEPLFLSDDIDRPDDSVLWWSDRIEP